MRPRFLITMVGLVAAAALLVTVASVAQAQEPVPMGDYGVSVGCHSCSKCNPCSKCKPACPPSIVYKGCPAPCATERVVTVTKRCGCSVDVVVKVPAGCEKVKVQRDGDQRIEVGRYGVHMDWQDKGSKLVVRYHS